ncbi:MAG: dihydrodipicolinate synthase family protein [Synergistetes bacterium]|nr:dihydrodipicolinate synthase family protein [Synergistota bacterium]MDW8192617.1 dihydrodipicolinate synthase family protein [Synergistota bacterium]
MVKKAPYGIIIPPVIPFKKDGALDKTALKELIEFWCKHVDGFFICGTVSSGPLMTVDEKKELTEKFIEYVNGCCPVFVHVGSPSTYEALDLAKHAERAGADAIAAVPPYYYPHTSSAIKSYYETILSSVSLPFYVYTIPQNTNVNLSVELLKELADMGINGIKDSTLNFSYHMELRRKLAPLGFEVIQGSDSLLVPSWMAGSRACVSGIANGLPELVKDVLRKCEERYYEEAFHMQQVLLSIRDSFGQASFIPMLYGLLKLRGLNAGYPRQPFIPVSDDLLRNVEQNLKELGVL